MQLKPRNDCISTVEVKFWNKRANSVTKKRFASDEQMMLVETIGKPL